MDHPNIVQIIEYFIEPSIVYIILETIPGDKIINELYGKNKSINFSDVVKIIMQLFGAVEYMHRKMIAHRAITPDNILLIWKDNQPIVKLVDFSQATPIDCPRPTVVLREKRNVKSLLYILGTYNRKINKIIE